MTDAEKMIESLQDWTTKKDLTKGWFLDSRLVLVKMAFIGGWQAAKKTNEVDARLCDVCGKSLNNTTECAWTSCPLNWNEARIDIIGQNGATGDHYESN